MAAKRPSPTAIDRFVNKLDAWAHTLDATQQAMLIDMLAKAGGDVHGFAVASQAAAPTTGATDSSDLSPLESGDLKSAVHGIFAEA